MFNKKFALPMILLFTHSVAAYPDEAITSKNLSGNFDITSNYVWRGVSQTNNGPAVQGGFTYTFDNGIYANIWGSNVDFKDNGNASLEFDPSIGYAGKLTNDLGYDVGIIRYNYPKSHNLNFNEMHITGTYRIFSLGVAYSNNAFNSGGNGIYYATGLNYAVPATDTFGIQDIGVSVSVGRYALSKKAGNSYVDYSIGINKKINKIYNISLTYTDTNGKFSADPLDKRHLISTLSVAI